MPAVARAMERCYNGVGYKTPLATNSGRVKSIRIRAEWQLAKRTAQRAKLTWTYKGKGVVEYDGVIVTPRSFGPRSFYDALPFPEHSAGPDQRPVDGSGPGRLK